MLYKIIFKISSVFFGKKRFQFFFEKAHKFSLLGMNIGGGGDLNLSGEKKAIQYVKNKIEKKDNIILFDVGANIGMYSLFLYSFFGEKSKIHSFEPSLKTFNKALQNISDKKNIVLNQIGFGSIQNKLTLYSDKETSGLASVYKRKLDHFDVKMSLSEEIEIETIDNYCEKNNIDHIDFLKLDIEGHEFEALKGAVEMIRAGKVSFIQFEFGGCNIDSRTYFQDFFYLLNDRYKIYRILKNGLQPINIYKETYEVFITTNFLAEKKNES